MRLCAAGKGVQGLMRAVVDGVVTEHGVTRPRHQGVDARDQALMALAAPEHQDALQKAWHSLRRAL